MFGLPDHGFLDPDTLKISPARPPKKHDNSGFGGLPFGAARKNQVNGRYMFFHLGFRTIAHPTQALLYRLQDNGN